MTEDRLHSTPGAATAPPRSTRTPERELTTLEFLVTWAERGRTATDRRSGTRVLTPADVAIVTVQAAVLLGDRAMSMVTLGDLARLRGALTQAGMRPDAARAGGRAIGAALLAAVVAQGSPSSPPESVLRIRARLGAGTGRGRDH